MTRCPAIVGIAVLGPIAWLAGSVLHGQSTVTARQHSSGTGFYEQTGTQWGFNSGGLSFSFGGVSAQPNSGRPDANAGLQLGFASRGSHGSGYFLGTLAQGSHQSYGSQSPSITLSNGMPGFTTDASWTPFVVGYYPVVGGWPAATVGTFGSPGVAVQLPTWSMFGTGTSVLVPDQGAANLGGINRAAGGQSQFGPPGMPGQRAMGGQAGAAQQQVRAQVHDIQGMDEAILAGGQQARPPIPDAGAQALNAAQASSAGRAAPSVAEAQRQRAAEQATDADEALTSYRRAEAAEAEGKPGLAKVYYRMTARRATGELRQKAITRLTALEPVKAAARQDGEGSSPR